MIGKEDFLKAMSEAVERWPSLKGQLNVYYSHLNFMEYNAFERICHRFVEEYKSMPLPINFKEAFAEWKKEKWQDDPVVTNREEFKVVFNINCKQCGKKNTMCIQEPTGASPICKQCYTGLNNEQTKDRFQKLTEIASGKLKLSEPTRRKYTQYLQGDRILDVDPNVEFERIRVLHEQAALLRSQNKNEVKI